MANGKRYWVLAGLAVASVVALGSSCTKDDEGTGTGGTITTSTTTSSTTTTTTTSSTTTTNSNTGGGGSNAGGGGSNAGGGGSNAGGGGSNAGGGGSAPVWTCNPDYQNDADCDCGCGLPDAACADATVGSCQYCSNPGSCNLFGCPGNIDPLDNSTCTLLVPGWTCDPAKYDAGDGCNCGCGVADPDCADATLASCDNCDSVGTCNIFDGSGNLCPGNIVPANNAICAPAHPGWTCDPNFFEAADGCDCGCGLVDPDCADATAGSCQYCDGTGSCDPVGDCAAIDPANNGLCQ